MEKSNQYGFKAQGANVISVILYGELGKLYGKYHKYSVKSVPEAIRALEANFKGFSSAIKKDSFYKVIVDKEVVSEDTLTKTANKKIKIIPVVQGGGKGVGQIIAGIALLVVAWWNPYAWGSVATGLMTSVGSSLVLGGISQMLTKPSKTSAGADRPDQNPSYLFDGPVNTTAQGNPVPLAYGKMLCGSQVISAGLEVR